MSNPFAIGDPSIVRRLEDHEVVVDLVDVSDLFLCLERFLAVYEGTFALSLGETVIRFDLDPDLSAIFEDLPETFEALSATESSSSEIVFYEQGTDVTFDLQRRGEALDIAVRLGEYAGVRYRSLKQTRFSVEYRVFVAEWCGLAMSILDRLLTFEPKIAESECFRVYAGRITAARASLTPPAVPPRPYIARAKPTRTLQGVR